MHDQIEQGYAILKAIPTQILEFHMNRDKFWVEFIKGSNIINRRFYWEDSQWVEIT